MKRDHRDRAGGACERPAEAMKAPDQQRFPRCSNRMLTGSRFAGAAEFGMRLRLRARKFRRDSLFKLRPGAAGLRQRS